MQNSGVEGPRKLTRRALVLGAGATVLGGLLAACGGSTEEASTAEPTTAAPTTEPVAAVPTAAASPSPSTSSGGAEPIRIGVIGSYTGPFAELGRDLDRGMQLYLDSVNHAVAGRPIEVITVDDVGSPEQGIAKARQLVEQQNVHILSGVILSNVALALRDYIHTQQIPLVIANAGAAAITRDPERRSPYLFRASFCNGQSEWPLGPYAYGTLGLRRVAITAPDYAAGHEKANAFKYAYLDAGGEIVDEVWPPLDTNDFGPYLQRLQQSQPEAIWAFFSGVDAVRFVQQYADFGLRDSIPLLGEGGLTDEAWINEIGEAALGAVTTLHYAPLYDSAENKAFVEAYQDQHGELPGVLAYTGYVSTWAIVAALEQVSGDVEDKEAFLEALRGVSFTGPTGEFRFNPETQNVIITAFIRRVEQLSDGTYGNVVIATEENVDDVSYQL